MDREFVVYVSASPEVDAECEQVGQLLATLARTSRATIRRTPRSSVATNPDLAGLAQSDLYIAILATDLSAPVGVEWQAAQQSHRQTLAYRNALAHPSPAMQHFYRHNDFQWIDYQGPAAFRRTLERTLLRRLLDGTPGFGLDLADVEQIAARLKELEGQRDEEALDERRGAGRGGVILPHP